LGLEGKTKRNERAGEGNEENGKGRVRTGWLAMGDSMGTRKEVGSRERDVAG